MIPNLIDVYKKNAIYIAKHHRKYCEGDECNISLWTLMMMAEQAGCKFNEEERGLFI